MNAKRAASVWVETAQWAERAAREARAAAFASIAATYSNGTEVKAAVEAAKVAKMLYEACEARAWERTMEGTVTPVARDANNDDDSEF